MGTPLNKRMIKSALKAIRAKYRRMPPRIGRIRFAAKQCFRAVSRKETSMIPIETLRERIEPLVSAGQFEKAIEVCQEARRADADNVDLLLLLGRLNHRAGNARRAGIFLRSGRPGGWESESAATDGDVSARNDGPSHFSDRR